MPGLLNVTRDHHRPNTESVAPAGVKLLLERFPHVQMVSLQLLVKNEAFRELCEEYAACTAAAQRFDKPGTDDALRKEYNALLLRLEGELLGYLERQGSGDEPR